MAFECKIAADSLAPCGARLTTFIVTYPRAIHSEIMTHRMLTKSSASSRAIPTEKLIERVEKDPWIPDYIGKNQKGMQPGTELSGDSREEAVSFWLAARDQAVQHAKFLMHLGVHKGVVNRIIEPWMWITVIISGTEWDNFFGLRTHEAAEPHFQHIARMMHQQREDSLPQKLAAGEWHLPLIYSEDVNLAFAMRKTADEDHNEILRKVSVGRCARVSYLNHEGVRDLKADIDLHDRLMVQRPLHAAPAEHVAQAMDWPQWYRGFGNGVPVNVYDFRSSVVERRRDRTRGDVAPNWYPKDYVMREEACFGDLQSGNYLGFKQYRKTLADEHIGGLMP